VPVWKAQLPPAARSIVVLAVAMPSGRPTLLTGKIETLGVVAVRALRE
jgi:hypothetical protein